MKFRDGMMTWLPSRKRSRKWKASVNNRWLQIWRHLTNKRRMPRLVNLSNLSENESMKLGHVNCEHRTTTTTTIYFINSDYIRGLSRK